MKSPAVVSGKALIRDYLMAYRIRQLPTVQQESEIWYHGASDIKTWVEGELEHFELGITDAVKRGVEVQRLFVFEEPVEREPKDAGPGGPNERMKETLRRHAEIARDNPKYEWRVISRAILPEIIHDKVPFALFRDGKNVDVEVAQGDDIFRFGATRTSATLLEEGFNAAWKKVRKVESMRDVLSDWADEFIKLMKPSEAPVTHQEPSPDDQKSKGNPVREQSR